MARAHLQAISERAEKEKGGPKPPRRSRMDGLLQPTKIPGRRPQIPNRPKDEEIDGVVYELYGLGGEEVKVVEGE
jgi:hypothetical protein